MFTTLSSPKYLLFSKSVLISKIVRLMLLTLFAFKAVMLTESEISLSGTPELYSLFVIPLAWMLLRVLVKPNDNNVYWATDYLNTENDSSTILLYFAVMVNILIFPELFTGAKQFMIVSFCYVIGLELLSLVYYVKDILKQVYKSKRHAKEFKQVINRDDKQ